MSSIRGRKKANTIRRTEGDLAGVGAVGSVMRIKEIRTRVMRWRGETVPLPPHFCTNPMDLLNLPEASMQTFTFHGWLAVEIFTDDGLVGIGNAALAPQVTKQVIDLHLKTLLMGKDPWDIEFLWQLMYRRTMAFGRRGIGMVAISAVDIALWDILGKSAKQPVYRLLGGRTKPRIPVYASRLYSVELNELAAEAKRYKAEGYKAMKLRLGWGPTDGAVGMQRNVNLVRIVRETVGDGIDVMADAYMGWTLDYAKRMLPLLEPFNLRWLEEPVIPDDVHGYADLKSCGRVPIAGGEHEFTVYGFRDLLEARALDYVQFDTNRVGGLSQARKVAALAEAYSVPVIPHAGQMHNYHVVMASLNSPMAEYFPVVDVEVGNELFWYIFNGEPKAKDGFIDLDENVSGLGLTINEAALQQFEIIE
jgi:L-rhamnonate dehydratase